MDFDPYYQWLGIPPSEQPADCYQLLGLRRFEENPTAISNAAERQLLMLKSMQNGPHAAVSQKLMNEVAAARIRLLNPEKKKCYDAELRQQLERSLPPLPPVLSQMVEPPAVAPSAAEPRATAQPPQSAAGDRDRVRGRRPPVQPLRHLKRRQRIALATGAAAGIAVVSLWLLFGSSVFSPPRGDAAKGRQARVGAKHLDRPADRDGHNADRATTSRVVGEERSATVPDPLRSAPPSDSIMSDDVTKIRSPVAGKDVPQATSVAGKDSGSTTGMPDGTVPGAAVMPSENVFTESTAGGASGVETRPDEIDDPDEPEERAFSRLPHSLDLVETVSVTKAGYVFIGALAHPANEKWRIVIEDFAASRDRAEFSVGAATFDDGILRWPVLRSVIEESPAADASNTKKVPQKEVIAHIEVQARQLALLISDPDDRTLLGELSMCSIVFDNGKARHQVQLSLPRRIPPIVLDLEDAKQTVSLSDVPPLDEQVLARLFVEILRVDFTSVDGSIFGGGTRIAYGEEQVIELNTTLKCELSITLKQTDNQLILALLPRYARGNRKLPLVPSRVTKEITRTRTQLARNQRDLAGAQQMLQRLPQEISRARSMVPRNPAEVAARQALLSQLAGRSDSVQARIRRLSKVIPDLSNNIAALEKVLAYANSLSGRGTLQLRVYLQGSIGQFVLLLTSAESPRNASSADASDSSQSNSP